MDLQVKAIKTNQILSYKLINITMKRTLNNCRIRSASLDSIQSSQYFHSLVIVY